MSVMSDLRALFGRRRAPEPSPVGPAQGVFTPGDREYRQQRIEGYLELVDEHRRAAVTELLDAWLVEPYVSSTFGHPEEEAVEERRWIAYPGWDDEPHYSRPSFASREAAVSHVEAVGGMLFGGDGRL